MRWDFFCRFVPLFWRYVLVLAVLPVLELFLMLFFLGQWITYLTMILGGIVGVFCLQRDGISYWFELNRCLDRGGNPAKPALHGALILAAVMLLILPGLLTSMLGLMLLFPPTRAFAVSYLLLQMESYRYSNRGKTTAEPETIDIT